MQNQLSTLGRDEMGKKSFLDKIIGNKIPEAVATESGVESLELVGDVGHLWMKEKIDAKKPVLKKRSKS